MPLRCVWHHTPLLVYIDFFHFAQEEKNKEPGEGEGVNSGGGGGKGGVGGGASGFVKNTT